MLQLPLSRFRCDGCGYGASCRIAPERRAMCGGSVWMLERSGYDARRSEPPGSRSRCRSACVPDARAAVRYRATLLSRTGP
jgi:hypothetical protein